MPSRMGRVQIVMPCMYHELYNNIDRCVANLAKPGIKMMQIICSELQMIIQTPHIAYDLWQPQISVEEKGVRGVRVCVEKAPGGRQLLTTCMM